MYLGIDLTSGEGKPSACALLDGSGRLVSIVKAGANAEILDWGKSGRSRVVAIDSPLFYPRGMNCLEEPCQCGRCDPGPWALRAAERRLFQEGISCYATTKKTFIKPMIYRAIKLASAFKAMSCQVIEVYPYASKVRLFGKPIPKKSTLAGRLWLRQRLEPLIDGLAAQPSLNHDQLDALVAAYTAYLFKHGYGEEIGDPAEGVIVVPAR